MNCWIIFDTSTRIEYVRDLLNLLGAPPGMMMRYDYRSKWVSDDAIAAIEAGNANDWPVILAYAQWIGYTRGMTGKTSTDVPLAEMRFVPTRTARMHLVTRQASSDACLFDFEVMGYPKVGSFAFDDLMKRLYEAGTTPHRKWVTTIETSALTGNVLEEASEGHWQNIVTALATPPMQFVGDTFWRLRVPNINRRSAPGRLERKWSTTGGEPSLRRLVTHFNMHDTERCSFELESFQPDSKTTPVTAERIVTVSAVAGDAIEIVTPTIHLRQAGSEIVEFGAKPAATLAERQASVRLASGESGFPAESSPVGPDMTLTFAINKSRWRIAFAFLFLVAAGVTGVIVPKMWDVNRLWAVSLSVISGFCLLLAGLVGFQQLQVKS